MYQVFLGSEITGLRKQTSFILTGHTLLFLLLNEGNLNRNRPQVRKITNFDNRV